MYKNPSIQKNEIYQLYDFFNFYMFDAKLPPCLISIKNQQNGNSYYRFNKFITNEFYICDEIIIRNSYISMHSEQLFLTDFVHQMVHLWQQHFGTTGRRGYHNKQWAEKMISIGLMPTESGQPGGKPTGDKVSQLVIKDGLFDKATNENLRIEILDAINKQYNMGYLERGKELAQSTRNRKVKYTCPSCGDNVWGKPGLKIICGKCNVFMEKNKN